MTNLKIALAAIAASLSLSATAAQAATCASHADIIKQLSSKFSEARQGIGLANQSTVIELFVGREGSWTLLATDTKGQTCLIGSGEAWQAQPKMVAGLDS